MLKFENIIKRYNRQDIISDMSFEVKRGKLVVLIGPSGCGKTTLLKMVNRLTRPTSGKIYLNGEDIFTKDEIELRRNIGYVIQQTGLFPHMTIRENLEIIPRLQKKDPADITGKSLELMDMVGLDPEQYLDRYPTQLSGGQQQRIGVARAFACDPDLILMDEPFSALDPITRSQLQDELVDLQAKVRKTIVFVTHDMDEAVKIADKICFINNGQIIQYDTPEELMKNPANELAAEFIGKHRIWSSPEFIRAKDIMIHDPVCAPDNTTALQCVERMRNQKVDQLFIIDKQMHLLGIVTAEEIQLRPEKNIPASSIIKEEFETISPEDNIIDILQTANKSHLSAIPVINESNVLQGLITKSSLVTTLSQQYIDTSEEIVCQN